MSSPSSRISPDVGGKKPVIRLKNVVLPAPFGPMIARSSPGRDVQGDVVDRDQAAERLGRAADFEQAHVATLRCSMPSRPRGKNSTTSTKIRPMKLIQFTVIDEM